jgi:hypothetical protein
MDYELDLVNYCGTKGVLHMKKAVTRMATSLLVPAVDAQGSADLVACTPGIV